MPPLENFSRWSNTRDKFGDKLDMENVVCIEMYYCHFFFALVLSSLLSIKENLWKTLNILNKIVKIQLV